MKVQVGFLYLLYVIAINSINSVFSIRIPQNSNPQPLSWWQQQVIYQIYPRSFQDSDDNGIGDLQGIQSRLDHLKNLGIGAVWISPIYPSPMKEFGYDISDFISIDQTFGSLESFHSLNQALKQNDIRLIMDFVPNHTSDLHPWFNASIYRQDPYTNYYVWRNASSFDSLQRPLPPNNWISVFGGSMWEWNEIRQQFYLHQFLKEQPDLNVENPKVVNELLAAMKIWLDRGVDGFRMDAVAHLIENLEDWEINDEREDPKRSKNSIPWDYSFWEHLHTYNLPDSLNVLAEMRKLMDVYTLADGKERVMIVEAIIPAPNVFSYYGTSEKPNAHFPLNFDLINGLPLNFNASTLENVIAAWLENLKEGQWANWLVGNHDTDRVASRFGDDYVDFFNMLVLLLPGSAVTYYGEEIGMRSVNVSWEDTVDPRGKNAGQGRYHLFTRDPERTPMPFTSGINGGFSTANKLWLPLDPNYKQVNVEVEENQEQSHLKVYRKLVKLRDTDVWRYGSLETMTEKAESICPECSVFGFSRIYNGKGFIVLASVGNGETKCAEVNVARKLENIPSTATIYTASVGFQNLVASNTGNLYAVNTSSLILCARNAIVFGF